MQKSRRENRRIFTGGLLFLSTLVILLTAIFANQDQIKIAANIPNCQGQILSAETENKESNNQEKKKINEYQVPILMYHYIRDYDNHDDRIGINLSVSPEIFAKQLEWLRDNNYQTINLDDIIDMRSFDSTQDQNHKFVILTFDDGYIDAFANAFPTLKKYRFSGTFYITSDFIGHENYLSWGMIKRMNKSGMKFGGHTMTHPDLTNLDDEQLSREIVDNKMIIENQIEKPITDFCYPSGQYNDRIMNKLKEVGYKTATTTHHGITNQNSDKFQLPRIRMTNNTKLEQVLK